MVILLGLLVSVFVVQIVLSYLDYRKNEKEYKKREKYGKK